MACLLNCDAIQSESGPRRDKPKGERHGHAIKSHPSDLTARSVLEYGSPRCPAASFDESEFPQVLSHI